jgi:uncharacterized MAPEG superfamily protein
VRPELQILAWAVLLAFAQALIAATGAMMQVGLAALAGNREGLPEIKGWAGRAARAHRNMIENLVLFAALVLIAVYGNVTNPQILLGAKIFLWARVGYALVYIAGIPWLRTLLWVVSVAGMGMILLKLFLR